MKRILLLFVVLMLMFSGIALANSADQVSSAEDYVGKDVVLEEGHAGITAISAPAPEAVAPHSSSTFRIVLIIAVATLISLFLLRPRFRSTK